MARLEQRSRCRSPGRRDSRPGAAGSRRRWAVNCIARRSPRVPLLPPISKSLCHDSQPLAGRARSAAGAALPGSHLRLGRLRAGAESQPLGTLRHTFGQRAGRRRPAASPTGRRISALKRQLAEARGSARDAAKAELAHFLADVVPQRLHVSDAVWARHHYGYTGTQAQSIFATGIMVFSLAMIFAGRWQDRVGPRRVAMTGGWVLAAGYALAALAGPSFPVVWLAIGVLGGAGIGLAYVCPVAACVKWFPDLRGLITGLAVAGFGGGAFLFIKLAGNWGGLIARRRVGHLAGLCRGLCRGDHGRRRAAQSTGRLAARRLVAPPTRGKRRPSGIRMVARRGGPHAARSGSSGRRSCSPVAAA